MNWFSAFLKNTDEGVDERAMQIINRSYPDRSKIVQRCGEVYSPV